MNELLTYLINYAFDRGISTKLTDELPALVPHSASAKRKSILINLNYGNRKELPFAVAHEIGHVMDGDSGIRYYKSPTIHNKAEYRASTYAVNLLINYCQLQDINCSNPVRF